MGDIEKLDFLIKRKSKGVFYYDDLYYCDCGSSVSDLQTLTVHLVMSHLDSSSNWDTFSDLLDKFKSAFQNEGKCNSCQQEEDVIILPQHLLCVCLNEYDIGLTSDNVPCSHCTESFGSMDLMTKHRADKHKYSQRIEGENILFEKPDRIPANQTDLTLAYFCPQPACKYSIGSSGQSKFFQTFKLLKQHYLKSHATRNNICNSCSKTFPSESQLKVHSSSCGKMFACPSCDKMYKQYESLQTHGRRMGHFIPSLKNTTSTKTNKARTSKSPEKAPIPIVPKPSKNHIQAALALSELSSFLVCRADIGIQTDHTIESSRTSPVKGLTPDRSKSKVTSGTQTKSSSTLKRKLPPDRVNSQVQTQGEYLVKSKREKKEKTSQGSQCRISSERKMKNSSSLEKIEMMTQTTDLTSFGLSVDISNDWMDWTQLWPLVRNTNGTQTSPRVMQRKLSEDSSSDSMPDLEDSVQVGLQEPAVLVSTPSSLNQPTAVLVSNQSTMAETTVLVPNSSSMVDSSVLVSTSSGLDETSVLVSNPNTLLSYHHPSTSVSISTSTASTLSIPVSSSSSVKLGVGVDNSGQPPGVARTEDIFHEFRKKFGEVRQFSTETQTDLDACQENLSWTLEGDDLELPGAEKLLNKMETQETQTAHEDLLLCINTCTQTGDDYYRRYERTPTDIVPATRRQCNTESQTRLTGLVQPEQQIVSQEGSSVQTADAQLMTDAMF